MGVAQAAKYLQQSRGWAYGVMNIFESQGNVDFSNKRGGKRTTTSEQDRKIVELGESKNSESRKMTAKEIAQDLTAQGIKVSRSTVSQRLSEVKSKKRSKINV